MDAQDNREMSEILIRSRRCKSGVLFVRLIFLQTAGIPLGNREDRIKRRSLSQKTCLFVMWVVAITSDNWHNLWYFCAFFCLGR